MIVKKPSNWVYVLLAFGVIISGPRFSGAFASAIGVDLFRVSQVWAIIEIGSGWALAIFEAMAVAYIASRFRRIQILNEDESLPLAKRIVPANAVYWLILLMGQVFLLMTIPAVSTVHLATQTFREVGGPAARVPDILTWSNLFQNHLTWAWLFVTAAASTLFVFLIGLVMDDFGVLRGKEENTEHKTFDAFNRLRKVLPIVDPQALAKEADIPLKDAADFLDGLQPSMREPNPRLEMIKRRMNNGA